MRKSPPPRPSANPCPDPGPNPGPNPDPRPRRRWLGELIDLLDHAAVLLGLMALGSRAGEARALAAQIAEVRRTAAMLDASAPPHEDTEMDQSPRDIGAPDRPL